jgi:hypothetical protein
MFGPLSWALAAAQTAAQPVQYDVAVYGATGAGCVAAIAASRAGATGVLLVSQTNHVGGMLTGGLQHTDSANDTVIQGITREFFVRTEEEYPGRPTGANYPPGRSIPGWLFESHVGERVLNRMLAEANITVVRGAVNVATVTKMAAFSESESPHDTSSSEIAAFTTESAEPAAAGPFAARVFVDASYEGDLLDRAGCTMTWGRESTAQYSEAAAGRRAAESIGATISPWWNASAMPLVALPHVRGQAPVPVGAADRWVEPMTFRVSAECACRRREALSREPE